MSCECKQRPCTHSIQRITNIQLTQAFTCLCVVSTDILSGRDRGVYSCRFSAQFDKMEVQKSLCWIECNQTRESRIKHQWETRDSISIYDCTFSITLTYIFASGCFGPFLPPPPFHLAHLLQLLVPHCSLLSPPPHQIFCSRTTAAPFLQSSPLIHTTDILAHCLVSLLMCTRNSRSLGRFSAGAFFTGHEAPAAEHACFCTDRLVVYHNLPPS